MSSLRDSYPVLANPDRFENKLDKTISLFNEQKSVQRKTVFNLNAIYPLSLFRDIWSAGVTHNLDRYTLPPGDFLETARIGRYVPGFSAEGGIGGIMDAGAEGRFGVFSLRSGFFFEYTVANGIRVGNRRATVDNYKTTNDPEFIDKLDGNGLSGITYNPEEGYIIQIDIPYYGFGPIVFSISKRTGPDITNAIMYPFAVLTLNQNTSTDNPNLPVRAENIGGSGNIYVTGRQYCILGDFTIATRKTGASSNIVTINSTDWTPIISFRRRTGDDFDFYTLATDSIRLINGVSDIEYQFLLNGSLTGAVPFFPDNRSSGETSIEFDRSATAITGGEQFFSDLIQGSDKVNERVSDSERERIEIPRDYWVTLVGKCLVASETSDVRAHVRALEQF